MNRLAALFAQLRTGRRGTTLTNLVGCYLRQEGPTDMSSHKDRSTSQRQASPDRDRPDTVLTAFTSVNSRPFDLGSSCQYRGRRRYGPAQQVF